MNTQISIIGKSNINIISQLLKFENQTNTNTILYKQTAKNFKKKYGIELENAPIIFTAANSIWKLSHRTHNYNGRTYEYADYSPIVDCKGLFTRMERVDIFNKCYNKKATA